MDISLYIPAYNAAKTIGQVIEAALAQTYPIQEIIVVIDGATDRTKRIVDTYPVKLISTFKNKGLGETRTKAMSHVSTEYVAALDSDCIPQKNWLENLVKGWNRYSLSGIAGVGGKLEEGLLDGVADEWRTFVMQQHWGDNYCVPSYLFGSNTLFLMKALREIGYYEKRYTTNYEDVDLCARLKRAGYTFIYIPDAVVSHHKSDTISTVLESYWRWQLPPKFEAGRYSDFEQLKEQINYNLSYSLALINRIVLSEGGPELLYPSLLSYISHSFLDLKKFIEINSYKSNFDNAILNLSVAYTEMMYTSFEWIQKEFYLENWVMKRVIADLIHLEPIDSGISGKVEIPSYKEDVSAKKFIEFFYRRMSRYLSLLNKVAFNDMWKMVESLCLK